MKRSLAPTVLLAAPLTAAAQEPPETVTCRVVAHLDAAIVTETSWPERLAKGIAERRGEPQGACVDVDEGAQTGMLAYSRAGWTFVPMDVVLVPASGALVLDVTLAPAEGKNANNGEGWQYSDRGH